MDLIEIFEKALKEQPYSSRAPQLYSPIKYTLGSGGKRIRPLLCMKACEAFGKEPSVALNQAIAIEMFHNFTLIHDDVMDHSDIRRSNPTVYAKWGEVQAILSGDALLTIATQKVSECELKYCTKILEMFNKTALEVYEGQQLDMEFENRSDVTTDEYLEMIRLKTSVLLGCACALGAIVGGADPENVDRIYTYGEKLGLAFQLRDDWLDTYGDANIFGKNIGMDIKNRKKTWLFITALSEAPEKMAIALNSGNDEIVEKVIGIYDSLNLSKRCDEMIHKYYIEAKESIKKISIDDKSKAWFIDLAEKLCSRIK